MVRVLVLALLVLAWYSGLGANPSSALGLDSAPPMYDLIDLGTLGGEISKGNDIDAAGRVIGQSQTKGNAGCGPAEERANHAFVWQDGQMIDLGTLGGTNSEALAFGPGGQIVGWSETANGSIQAALWTPDAAIADLGTLNGADSFATAVNAGGHVVGVAEVGSGEYRAFLAKDGQMTAVAPLESATAIDDEGWILGEQQGGGSMLVKGDQVTDLAPLIGAVGMDAAGRVFGSIYWEDSAYHAAIWDDGVIMDLGALPDRPDSFAMDVNSSGQVVGVTMLHMICGYSTEAAIWTDGTLLPLGNQVAGDPVQLVDARAINDSGQIVASLARHGTLHAVRLTPQGVANH